MNKLKVFSIKCNNSRIFILILSLMMLVSGCGAAATVSSNNLTPAAEAAAKEITEKPAAPSSDTNDTLLNVHFIDVGQGDATLIESDGHFMLIDAGENDQAQTVISYLSDAGVKRLDYVIGTHPHSDHIGGLDKVIDTFEIGKVILPAIEHTTKTFEDLLDSIINKSLTIAKPVVGDSYKIGSAEFIIIAPNKEYGDDLNNWSVGIKLTYKENSFVLTGDAESAEADILDNGIDLSADVFKAGHHGSSTSNSNELLAAIKPAYMVISCGRDNSYGHPHKEVMELIEKLNISLFRTDEDGTIVASGNGKDISWTAVDKIVVVETAKATPVPTFTTTLEPTEKPTATPKPTAAPQPTFTQAPAKEAEKSVIVHITKTGEKYHNGGCQYLKKSDISVSLEDAKIKGYEPCSRCNPPIPKK